jgi:hypothetical protein
MNKLIVFILVVLQPFFVFVQEVQPRNPGFKEHLEFWIEENDDLVLEDIVRYYDTLTSKENGSFSTTIRCRNNVVKEGDIYTIPDTNFVFFVRVYNELGPGNRNDEVKPTGQIRVITRSENEITLRIMLTEPSGHRIDKTLTFRRRK